MFIRPHEEFIVNINEIVKIYYNIKDSKHYITFIFKTTNNHEIWYDSKEKVVEKLNEIFEMMGVSNNL